MAHSGESDVPPNGNDTKVDPKSDLPTETASRHSQPAGTSRFGRLPAIFAGLVCVAGMVVAGAYYDVGGQISKLTGPRLVTVTGQITYHGKPVTPGFVQTEYANARRGGAIGTLDAEGRFSLQTDIDGTYHSGAYVGRHKLIVMATSSRGVQVIHHVPTIYTSAATTPLTIDVTTDPQQNHFQLVLEGDLDRVAVSRASASSGRNSKPGDLIKRLLAGDRNGDGKISKVEAPRQLLQHFDRVDANHDGVIDEDEMRSLATRFGRGSGRQGRSRSPSEPESPASSKKASLPAR